MSRHNRAEAPSVPLQVRLSPVELARVEEAARLNHQTRSQFTRDALDSATADCLDDLPKVHS